MAVTEQQFINDIYTKLTPDEQTRVYEKINDQGRQWIDNYNASINQGGNQNNTPTNNAGTNLGNWKYGDESPDRQAQIVNNLNEAYQQDPSRFSDWNTFAQNFNYNYSGRSDTERETMKNWYDYTMNQSQGKDYNDVNNTDYFLSQLINGQTLGGSGAATTAAYNRYKDYQSLSGMTPEQIASAISNNSINPVGQSMIDLKNYSPALYAQVQSILNNKTSVDDINSVGTGIYDGLTKSETNSNYTKYNFTDEYAKNASVIKQYNESLYKKIEGLGGDTAAYVSIVASMLQNPLIQANKDEIENIEGEINKIKENIWTISDTARAKLGSEAPEDLISAYISQQTKELQNQLRTAQNSLLVAKGKLDNQLGDVEILIDAINNGLKMYGEDEKDSKNNYQYISASKYQDAGYFDKNTGQFYKLGEMPDNHDYESDDPARLQDIADNLENIANSDDVYVFRDRNAFNNYFKYSQRSAAQKAVLDEFWNNNADNLKPAADAAYKKYLERQAAASKGSGGGGGGGGGEGGGDNDKWQKLKAAIIRGDVAGSYDKGNVKRYGFAAGLNEEEVAVKMAQICTAAEYQSLYNALGASARAKFQAEIKNRIQTVVTDNASNIKARMNDAGWSIGNKKREEEAKNLAQELGINFGSLGADFILDNYKSL